MSRHRTPRRTSEPAIMKLTETRRALLTLHKALLDNERVRCERLRGRIESSHEFLRLVINDPWFAWLRPFTTLIVQIDEFLADEESTTTAEALLLETRQLLLAREEITDFQREYQRALQECPDVVMAHSDWKQLAITARPEGGGKETG